MATEPPAPRRQSETARCALVFGVASVLAATLCWPAFEAKVNLPEALHDSPVAVAVAGAAAGVLVLRVTGRHRRDDDAG